MITLHTARIGKTTRAYAMINLIIHRKKSSIKPSKTLLGILLCEP